MLRRFLYECRRVLRVARKPESEEYWKIAKVTGIGIMVIGIVGFVIRLIVELIGA
ncbi:MAG: protein translocase SEC61 complex subunit gamma [Hadesarchaea archaeon]|nr:protein translocase SEC61 complex subunit gamma [Hadesarchaea archaeon]